MSDSARHYINEKTRIFASKDKKDEKPYSENMEKMRVSKVLLDLESKDKMNAIQEMVNHCSAIDKTEVFKSVIAREEKLSTYVGEGIAIPHAKCCVIENGEAVIARSRIGIDWGNGISHIIILVLSPMDISGPHVIFLSEVIRILSSKECRAAIMEAERAEDIMEVFHSL